MACLPSYSSRASPDRLLLRCRSSDAAKELRTNRELFAQNVRSSMAGRSVKGESFEKVLK